MLPLEKYSRTGNSEVRFILHCSFVSLKLQSAGLKNEAMSKCQKLQYLKWSLEADSTTASNHMDPHVKMPNFKAEINKFTAWYKNSTGL